MNSQRNRVKRLRERRSVTAPVRIVVNWDVEPAPVPPGAVVKHVDPFGGEPVRIIWSATGDGIEDH